MVTMISCLLFLCLHLAKLFSGLALLHIGVILGVILGLYWGNIRVILGLYWGNTRVILGLYWGNIRLVFGFETPGGALQGLSLQWVSLSFLERDQDRNLYITPTVRMRPPP